MGLIVIQTLNQELSESALERLRTIVGDFDLRRPKIDGMTLYPRIWHYYHNEGRYDNQDKKAVERDLDDIIARCGITDAEWQDNEILVIFTHWAVAGIEIRQEATLKAIYSRKGSPVQHIVFQDNPYDDAKPLTWPWPE